MAEMLKIYVTSILCTYRKCDIYMAFVKHNFFSTTITYTQAESIEVYAKYSIKKWLKWKTNKINVAIICTAYDSMVLEILW